MKQIEKFLNRMRKSAKLKKKASLIQSSKIHSADSEIMYNEGISEVDKIVDFCNTHGKTISNFLDSNITVPYDEEPQINLEKVLIEPLSDRFYGKEGITSGEVIEHEGEIFPLIQSLQINYGKGYKLRNIREIILNNSLQNSSNVVKAVTDNIKISDGNKFYLLSDSTNVFGENVKSAFGGYRMVWRSIAVAYMIGNFEKLSVADFMGDCVTEVTVGAEFSKKYDRIIYTRTSREILDKLKGLSYLSVARAFAEHILKGKDAVENIAVSNKLYNVMCKFEAERFVVDNRLLQVTAEDYKQFINVYLESYREELKKLGKNQLWADHLKNFLSGTDFVDNGKLSSVLEELDYRVKNKIPLWSETLPSLKLDRVALNGRLGNYYLVKEGEKVENTFENKLIKCPEVLVLPAFEKEIIFPLSISGVTDRHYIAKVTLEEPFENETECKVELIYNFNDEKTYSFNLYDSLSGKTYNMYIEEGEPERDDKPFEMRIDADADKIMDLLLDEFIKLKGFMEDRKILIRRGFNNLRNAFREKSWEIDARKTCNEIYSLWLKLPYETKKDKNNFKIFHPIIDNIIHDCFIPDYYDAIDRLKVMTVRCVVELFKDGYDITEGEYRETIEWLERENITSENNALHVISSRILSNPSICDPKLIDSVLKQSPEIARRLSLPLIANKALLEFLAANKMDVLCDTVKELEKKLSYCVIKIQSVPLELTKIKNVLKQIRDYWEFALGILRLRGSRLWNDRLTYLTKLKDIVCKLENEIYVRFFGKCFNYCTADICFSRIQFSGIPASLYAMHPLAYTLITYLEGNTNTHVIGCGLLED